jgi:hypothetical protein
MKRNKLLWVAIVSISVLLMGVTCNFNPQGQVDSEELLKEALQDPKEFNSAVIYYFPDKAVFSGAAYPTSLMDFCAPSGLSASNSDSHIAIGGAGQLSGRCSGESENVFYRDGTLSGEYNSENRRVHFRLETRLGFVPSPVGQWEAVLTFEGEGTVTGNTASAVGNFDYTRQATGEGTTCLFDLKDKHLELNGTMPFQIVFSP